MLLNSLDDIMAKCTKCGADITTTGYEAEELKLPNDVTGYLWIFSFMQTMQNDTWNSPRKIKVGTRHR
jgi:hypothetical protein